MGSVVFNPTTFKLRYTEFAAVPDDLLQLYFNEATFYLINDGTCLVTNLAKRAVFLNMLTAHIAKLNALAPDGQLASGLVGRISEASQGTVHVKADMGTTTRDEAWYLQTTYGAAYWAAIQPYISFSYVPAPAQCGRFGILPGR